MEDKFLQSVTYNEAADTDDVVHPIYLPFPASTLCRHFAPVGSTANMSEDYLRYYRESAERYKKFLAEVPNVRSLPLTTLRIPCQIEKDERFWTAACWLRIFYCAERTGVLSEIMRSCFGHQPPLKRLRTWAECFDGDLCLYFEPHLPSPSSYKRWLRQNLSKPDRCDSRVRFRYLIEFDRGNACS